MGRKGREKSTMLRRREEVREARREGENMRKGERN